MKNAIHAEIYKLTRYKLLWLTPIYYMVLGISYAGFDHYILHTCQGLALFVLPPLVRFTFPLGVAVVTAYAIGGDFTHRTFQNALYVGVSKRDYFFLRLLVQILITTVLCGMGMLAHIFWRLLFFKSGADNRLELLGGKLVVYLLVILLQLWVYTAIHNALCYFVKNQLMAIALSLVMMYLEAVFFQITNAWEINSVTGIMRFSPSVVLKYSFDVYAYGDRVFTFDFLKFGLSAILMTVLFSVMGYMKFRSDSGMRQHG